MLELLAESLIEIYRQDREDYAKLLSVMQSFSSALEKELESEQLEKELAQFAQVRDKIFTDLQARAAQTGRLQAQIGKSIGADISKETDQEGITERFGKSFQADDLKSLLQPQHYEELISLTQNIQTDMAKVLELDAQIIPKLSMELEAVKLELHRLQGAKKTRNVYENQGHNEARFIDKIK